MFPPELLPDGVVVESSSIPGDPGLLLPQERELIARAVPKRAREFAAGRACARRALERLGVRGHAILAAEDRAPVWPPGIVGSISHCDGCCAAAIAPQSRIAGLGIDVERFTPVSSEILDDILCAGEADHLSGLGHPGLLLWAKLAFSAKESLFKCYHGIAKTFLEFHDVRLNLLTSEERFVGHLTEHGLPSVMGTRSLAGRYAVRGGFIYTAVALQTDAPPAAGVSLSGPESRRP